MNHPDQHFYPSHRDGWVRLRAPGLRSSRRGASSCLALTVDTYWRGDLEAKWVPFKRFDAGMSEMVSLSEAVCAG